MAKKETLKKNSQAKPKLISSKPIFDKFGIGPDDAQKIMRDFYREMQQAQDDLELIETLKKTTLTSEEIWAIKPTTFYAWRIKHDLPRILAYFNERLVKFNEWKAEFGINDEFLMRHGISNCVGLKDIKDKDRYKYIFYKKGGNSTHDFLGYVDLSKKVSVKWGEPESFVLKTKFIGYLDWCDKNKVIPFPGRTSKNLFEFTSASNIRSNDIKVYILDKLELLKIGGITVQGNSASLINPKYFEFVNASFLILKGLINSAGMVLQFENSVVDDMRCEDLEYPLVDFNNSSVKNVSIVNSTISQWSFYKTIVTGKISNSSLNMIQIIGGGFHAILDNTFISDVFAQHTNELNFISTYQTLKKTYADQGDDKRAIFYFLKEKGIERDSLYNAIFTQRIHSSFKISWFKNILLISKASIIATCLYLSSLLNNLYWGYGRKPFRIIGSSLTIIMLCALFYQFNQDLMNKPAHQAAMSFADSFYFSSVTFTTLGYGDFTPNGFLRIITAFEAIFGGMSMGFLVAGFANLKY
jgi:hypothetical protein